MKAVDTYEYVSMLKDLVEEGKEVNMTISGSSMSPFIIHHRDKIFFKAPDRELKKGDIVFFQRDSGQYVVHRICKVKKEGYYIVGDGQTEIEGPVRPDQIFARVTRVERKGRIIKEGDFWWRFFETVWLWVLPICPLIVKLYNR